MKKETVEKMGQGSREPSPSEAGQSPPRLKTEIGGISKGSDTAGHFMSENQTTSTGSPRTPVSPDFFGKLGEMHDGETRLTHVLPILQLAAKSDDLKKLLGIHLEETRGHGKSLEDLAASSREKLPKRACEPIAHLIREGEIELIKNILDPGARDAAIIAAGRKIEQCEIESYTSLCAIAQENDWAHELAVLTSILNQEKLADELLAGVAEGKEPLQKLVEKASLKHVQDVAK